MTTGSSVRVRFSPENSIRDRVGTEGEAEPKPMSVGKGMSLIEGG